MANKRIEMLVLKQIIQLKSKGFSNRKIAVQLGVHRNSVNTYVASLEATGEPLEHLGRLTEAELSTLFSTGNAEEDERYVQLQALYPAYERELKKVGCTYQILWYGYKEQYPQGYGYTRFKHHLQQWAQSQQVSMPMDHKMGEKLFIDFTGKKLHYVDRQTGEQKEAEVFVGILGGSQYTYVEAIESQQKEDLIRSLINSFSYFGGVAQAIVCDNLKSAVDKSSKYEPLVNKNLSALALHYNTTILPTRAYKPQDKSLVEGAVKLAYQRIFYKLGATVFFSLTELNAAIKPLLASYNDQLFQGRDYTRKQLFNEEQKHLNPLPADRYEIKYYKRAKVQKNSHVWFGEDSHYYSVPYAYTGKNVELQYTKTAIEVYHNHQRLATHSRSKIIGAYSTQRDHMPSTHQYVKGWNADYFINWGQKLHHEVGSYIIKMFKRNAFPEQTYKSCMGLQELYRQYGAQRLTKACQRATEYERIGYNVLKNILQKGLDKLTDEGLPSDTVERIDQHHENTRGAEYYQ